MKTPTRWLAAFVMIALAIAPSAGQAVEDKTMGLFVNLTTLDNGMAGHALVFSRKALERGHPVAVFINHKAVLIAAEGVPQASYQGQTLHKHLGELIAKGAKVIVCRMCMAGHGMTEMDLMEGAVQGNPELVHEYLFDPKYQVMSW